jgi:hypothetical protein
VVALVTDASTLGALLRARSDPMVACSAEWLTQFMDVPDDAAVPLAMSGPHPRAVGSYGAEIIAWAEKSFGVKPRWWQALAITRQFEHDDDGVLVWREVVESGPRRIGKSVRLRLSAVWRTAHAAKFLEPQLSMLVSKDLAVGKEIHRGAWRWADKHDWNVLRLNGAQEIESPAGDRWLLRAPNAAYGYDVGYGQVDESWGVDPMAITDGLEPALLERQSPQLHLTSTAHVKASSLMRRRLTAALRNADQDVLLLLWGAHPDSDFADESTWRAASPHWSKDRRDLMARKYAAALAGQDEPEFDDPDPVRGWAAQYLNVWPLLIGASDSVLPGWDDCVDESAEPLVFAVGAAVAWGGRYASIAVAGMDGERLVVGAVKRAEGTSWLAAELSRIQEKHSCYVVVDEVGPTAALIPEMKKLGVTVTPVNTAAVAGGVAALRDRVREKTVAHPGHPDLDLAIAVAATRDVGERGPVWARKTSTGDISMLEAATNAAWIAATNIAPTVW